MPSVQSKDDTRTILVVMNDGSSRRVSNIPGNAKVTFSKMIPKSGNNYDTGSNCLRIYTSESNQLGVFVGVKEFQDSTLKVERKEVTKKKTSKVDKQNGETFTSDSAMEVQEEWVELKF